MVTPSTSPFGLHVQPPQRTADDHDFGHARKLDQRLMALPASFHMPEDGCKLHLSDRLLSQGIRLRREAESDFAFLERLYLSTRWEELAVTGWADEMKIGFLKQQYALQRHHYLTYYDRTDFGIIVRAGEPIGRLYLDRGPTEYRIVDISLLPEARGAGVGTEFLRSVHAEAEGAKIPVTLHVEKLNPAQRLYRRLGFQPVHENGPYDFMVWPVGAGPA